MSDLAGVKKPARRGPVPIRQVNPRKLNLNRMPGCNDSWLAVTVSCLLGPQSNS